jgi:peptide/nickel transport system substrate-binding protein
MRVATDPYDFDMNYVGKNGAEMGGQYGMGYEGLLTFKVGPDVAFLDTVTVPALAESWEVSADARSYTFHLRKGVKFANIPPVNGREMTAEDVKWSFEYWGHLGKFKGISRGPWDAWVIGIASAEAPDPYTAVIRFKEPYTPFLTYVAAKVLVVVPHEIFDQDGHFKNQIAGTGAFQLDTKASQKGSRWVWSKNPTYWQPGKPHMDAVRWLVINDESTGLAAFQTKQLDMLDEYSTTIDYGKSLEVRKAAPNVVVSEGELQRSFGPWLNTKVKPLDDERVRRAISLSVNREEFIQNLQGGRGKYEMPWVFTSYFTQDEIKQLQPYDPDQAKRLLAEAGYGNGVEFEVSYSADASDYYKGHIQLFQAQLRKTGINITLKPTDAATWSANRKKEPPAYVLNYTETGTGGRFDVDNPLSTMHSTSKTNYWGIKDPELDALIDAQRAEPNAEKRRDLVRKAGVRIVDKAYSFGFQSLPYYEFWHPQLKNHYRNLQASIYDSLTDAWLER